MLHILETLAEYSIYRELKDREKKENTHAHEDPLVLLPLEVMVKPLRLRFSYHFDGDRATNRLDKVQTFALAKLGISYANSRSLNISFRTLWVY